MSRKRDKRPAACAEAVEAAATLIGWARGAAMDPRVRMPASVRKMLRERIGRYNDACHAVFQAERENA